MEVEMEVDTPQMEQFWLLLMMARSASTLYDIFLVSHEVSKMMMADGRDEVSMRSGEKWT